MKDDAQTEALVDMITRRVQARLGGSTVPPPDAAPGAPVAQSGPACESVGAELSAARCGGEADVSGDSPQLRGTEKLRFTGVARAGGSQAGTGVRYDAPASDFAGIIDHTLLRADATRDALEQLCAEAVEHGFATVCVNACNVSLCAGQLAGTGVVPITVVGFPLGASTPASKAFETREAVHRGAAEIDMVINVGALRSGDYALVLEDISAVVHAAAARPVKVILETALLSEAEKIIACALAKAGGAAFVKTSTGFGPGGATTADIRLMRSVVGEDMGVKASGGVRTEADARAMIAAGATRLGASASVAIVGGGKADGGSATDDGDTADRGGDGAVASVRGVVDDD